MLNLPREIVELILFHVACPTLPGRPVSLEAVQLTCKRLHHYVHSSNDLHAQIFRFKFSHSRHGRMQGLTSADWRAELAQVDQALAHVQNRRGLDPVLESNEDILWRLYIMCHDDDDGINKLQLNAVNTYEWIQDFVLQHLYDGADSNGGWPAENAANSLALWILWFLTTKERLHLEPEAVSDRMVELVLPYVVAHFRYATAWAPPNHFHLPLPNQVILSNRIRSTTHFLSFQTPHGPFPKYRRDGVEWNLPLFEHRVSLCVPLVSIAARLLYFVRRELYPFGMNPNLPATRALAPPNHTGPTLEDITELNRNRLGGTDGRGGGTRVGCSLAHSEWARLRNCLSPWCGSSALHMHPIGSLTGLFAGRMMMTNEPIVNHIVQNPELPAGFGEMMLGFTSAPIYARFEELHSYYGEDVLPCTRRPASGSGSSPPDLMDIDDSDQEDDDSSEAQFTAEETAELDALLEARFDDGMFNGFLPTNSMFTNSDLGRRVAISAPSLDHEYLYHRHGKSSIPHDPDTCQGCSLRQAEMERRVDMDMDNERECRETLPPCTGVQDVIIRGSTDPNHAAAWNDYTYYGRVRKWDGMVIFVRLGPEKIVFYGYMTDDGNGLVGNWRIGVGEVGMPSLEGAFTMGRVHEDDESKQSTT